MFKSEIAIYYPSFVTICWNQFIRFIKIGVFLHVMAVLGAYLLVIGIQNLMNISFDIFSLKIYLWTYIALFGLVLLLFSEFDVRGRYQNYKQVKDKLYSCGYDERLVKPFIHSKCQRIAILVAAKDLKCADKMKDYFYSRGYRWYHILPDGTLKNPFVLFKKSFWGKILFMKYYKLQNFYW